MNNKIRQDSYRAIGRKCYVLAFIRYQVWWFRIVSCGGLDNFVGTHTLFFCDFSLISYVFINIYKYDLIIWISSKSTISMQ